MIQRHLDRSRKADPPNNAKIFAKLVMESQIHSVLRYLSEEGCGGVLPLSKQVMEQLADKHPEAQQAKLGSVLFGPVEDVSAILYQQINGEMVREAPVKFLVGPRAWMRTGSRECWPASLLRSPA